ncbi:glycerophosphodiester phosphodiesterase family protein [Sandaracinobacter sp. RS1-74]|uniref:glycerophosphodiester phosphodiesterase family protein n=1 Tax=Sandaracinobacteroides sayramensis TaxID=2913411 RepID=UPI001EDC49DC|nr:glycerophosphodiester phosphodiesterase family protein [Sandaracinobacteroides sayramensis]MCG2841432.1 glycerophosphodiester phosphodiesterase family protein [Sandaracinobacteroides sayramensis]
MRRLFALMIPILLAGCAVESVDTHRRHAREHPELSWVFDCLRTNRLALVSAHRGQKDPGAAENSLHSFRDTIKRGPILIEVDVARSADGVLMLMHDETVDRTTTGSGRLSDLSYRQLRQLYLKDAAGNVLEDRIPTLEEALIWARRNGAILQLDLKRGVTANDVVAMIRDTRTERQVILIAYDLDDTLKAMRAAPEMMVSASGRTEAETAKLLAMRHPRMLGFTGVREPSPELIARMDAAQVEAITGTLGKPGERLDDIYMADGKGTEYADLAARGVALIASDRPVDAWRALKSARRDGTPCLIGGKP